MLAMLRPSRSTVTPMQPDPSPRPPGQPPHQPLDFALLQQATAGQGQRSRRMLWLMLGLLVTGTVGFAAVGTLFAAMLVRARSRDVLLPQLPAQAAEHYEISAYGTLRHYAERLGYSKDLCS